MQPGQILVLTNPGTTQTAPSGNATANAAAGSPASASATDFNALLARLTTGQETALPVAMTRMPASIHQASEQGLLHANVRSVIGHAVAGTSVPQEGQPGLLSGLSSPDPASPGAPDTELSGDAATLLAQPVTAPQASPVPSSQMGDTAATGAGSMTLAEAAPASMTSPLPTGTVPATDPAIPASTAQASTAQASTAPATGMAMSSAPASTGAAIPTPADAQMAAAQPAPAATVSDPMGNAAGAAVEAAAKPAQLPANAAASAQSATQDNAKAGMKASVQAKLPTQAVPAQTQIPVPGNTTGADSPQQPATPMTGAPAQPQAIAQAQALNTVQTSATAATSLPADANPLKPAAALKDQAESRSIVQPRGASAMAAGASASASQTASASATGSSAAKPDTTAAVPTTTTSGAEPALPVQRELPPSVQPAAVQPAAGQPAALDTAPMLASGETADPAVSADLDLQAGRVIDPRAAADRSSAHLPRFAAHTTQTLAGQITRQFNQGNRVFDIRLDPAELGKVDVRLELRADNRVHAVLTAERPETLQELQRNARELERALNEAGLELGEEGLDFQMQDEGQSADRNPADTSGASIPVFTESETANVLSEAREADAPRSTYGFLLSRREGVDVRV